MSLEIKEISEQDMVSKGRWNKTDMVKLVKDLSIKWKNKFIQLNIDEFYKQFYIGSSKIVHYRHYCRRHLLDCMKKLNLNGFVSTSKNKLMISFK